MCAFGNSSKILEIVELTEENALVGYREFITVNKDEVLRSVNFEYTWPLTEPAVGYPRRENNEGIYNYKYYNYKYYNYNYYYCNYYYCNYNYNFGKTKLWGTVIKYKEGYRSQFSRVTDLVNITLEDKMDKKFVDLFNEKLERIAKKYNANVIIWEEFTK